MRRVQRAGDKENFVKALTTGENAPFKEIWRLLLFASAIGYRAQRRVVLQDVDAGKAMPQSYFSNNPAWPGFQYLMALVDLDDAGILAGSDENDDVRLRVFEEYANGGLEMLQEAVESSSCALDALVGFVAKNTASIEEAQMETILI